MAIGSDAAIEFFGTQDTVTSSSSSVADTAFSTSSDITTWTNDDDAPAASVTIEMTFSTAADSSSSVDLYCRPMNTQSTNDSEAPDAEKAHVYLGSFPVDDDTTSAQYCTIDVRLPNWKTSSEYEFYVQNNAGQSMSAGWDLYITPKTIGPHA